MTRPDLRPLRRGRCRRLAALRLTDARRRFERSSLALRKAALDHVDRQAEIGSVLQATLARLAPGSL